MHQCCQPSKQEIHYITSKCHLPIHQKRSRSVATMKLVCSINVQNRQHGGNQARSKPAKSTLALCKQPKTEEYCLLLFSPQHKNGAKYAIKNNITRVFTRFVNEGKATIQFKQPEQDVCIQADAIPLKSFLHVLKSALEGKVDPKQVPASSMAVTAVKPPQTKLVVAKRSDFPLKGFPRTLEVLHITDIRKCTVDRGILQLTKLRELNLSHNLIEYLPEEINKLPCLVDLDVSNNRLGASSPRQWDWMGGNLSRTLKTLILTSNNLKYLPEQVIKLQSLVFLYIDKNEIQSLPSGIGNLRNLRTLIASNNHITIVPGSVWKWKLETLDLSHNSFNRREQNNPDASTPKPLPVCNLKEYAARKVLHARISYDSESLPLTLMNYLDSAKYCTCGKACFERFIKHVPMMFLGLLSKTCITDPDVTFVPMDCYSCSVKCFAVYKRPRLPIVR